jgi:hypothetical protein
MNRRMTLLSGPNPGEEAPNKPAYVEIEFNQGFR